jgi:restriction system protein
MFPTSEAEGAFMGEMPTWEDFIAPTLRVMADGVTRTRRELHPAVADEVQLSADQRAITVASGQLLYANRIGWGLSLLAKTGALARPTRGAYVITEAGRYLLDKFPEDLTQRQVKESALDPSSGLTPYVAAVRSEMTDRISTSIQTTLTPVELIDAGMELITDELSTELISRLVEKDPDFFEEAVVKLLIGMGYGGELGKGWVTQRSNDGGIDGVIDQDLLGLNKVYIQAKRWQSNVGRPDLQAFYGALAGQKAKKGVFITTSGFTAHALDFAKSVEGIVLVDGSRLASLMIECELGVTSRTVKIPKIDGDYFDEELS